jgi:hypothetical protein
MDRHGDSARPIARPAFGELEGAADRLRRAPWLSPSKDRVAADVKQVGDSRVALLVTSNPHREVPAGSPVDANVTSCPTAAPNATLRRDAVDTIV